jgi:hypothetical protein
MHHKLENPWSLHFFKHANAFRAYIDQKEELRYVYIHIPYN